MSVRGPEKKFLWGATVSCVRWWPRGDKSHPKAHCGSSCFMFLYLHIWLLWSHCWAHISQETGRTFHAIFLAGCQDQTYIIQPVQSNFSVLGLFFSSWRLVIRCFNSWTVAYLANTMRLSFFSTLIFCEGFNGTILFRQYITLLLLYTRIHCVVLLSTGVSVRASHSDNNQCT